MSNPALVNYTSEDNLFAGDDIALQTTVYDTTGAAQNITGWTIRFKMATTKGGTAVLTKTPATLTTPASGVFTFSIAAADWPTVTADTTYFYEMRRTDSGSKRVIQEGTLVLQAVQG